MKGMNIAVTIAFFATSAGAQRQASPQEFLILTDGSAEISYIDTEDMKPGAAG